MDSDTTRSNPGGDPVESSGEIEGGKGKGPGAWAWVVIILAPILLLLSERLVPAAEAESEGQADLSLLALFQVQAKMIIAMDSVDGKEARQELRKLEPTAGSDETTAALAAVHGFLGLEDGGREEVEQLLARRSEVPGADKAFLEFCRQSILSGVDEANRETLRARLGWFADLLGVPGAPEKPPLASEIRTEAAANLFLVGIGLLTGLLAILSGAALLLIALILNGAGRLRFSFEADHPGSGVYLESFAIFLGSMALGNLSGWFLHWMAQPIIAIAGVVVALLWPTWRGIGWKRSCLALGLHRGRGWLREIGAGIVGYFMLLPMAIIGVTGSLLLGAIVKRVSAWGEGGGGAGAAEEAGGLVAEPVTHPAVGWMLGGWEARLLVFGLAVILAPLLEEIFFRGAFFRHLRTRLGLIGAGLFSGFIFAALHPQGWMAIPALTAMGFSFAAIREWRDSLIAPMTAHAINNGVLIGGLSVVLS